MRGLITALLLLAAVALAPATGSAQAAQTSAAPGTGAAPAPTEGWLGGSAGASTAEADDVMRTMYVSMGAMAGYMFAVMPVTTAAVTAAVASGVASMWAYDYLLAPGGAPAKHPH